MRTRGSSQGASHEGTVDDTQTMPRHMQTLLVEKIYISW